MSFAMLTHNGCVPFPKGCCFRGPTVGSALLIKGPHTFPLIPEELWGVSRLWGALLHSSGNNDVAHERGLALQPFGGKFCPPAYLVAEFHVSILNNSTYLETIA